MHGNDDFHKENNADVTIATMPVPLEEAGRFGIVIADDVKIGAGAVVTRSCHEPGATLVGVPAKILKQDQ